MKDKVLTVSIAAYNCERFIAKTLEPFCGLKNIDKVEIFVIDDGGTDNTLQIAETYRDQLGESLKTVHKQNGGWGSTVNYSILNSNGKYLKLLDGDDFFESENLDDFIEFLEKSDSDLVSSPYVSFNDETGQVVEKLFEYSDIKFGIDYFTEDVCQKPSLISMHALAVKVEMLQNNEISLPEHCFYTDNEFSIKSLINAKTVSFFDKPIYWYRTGLAGQSISPEGNSKHYLDTIITTESLCAYINDNKQKMGEKKAAYIHDLMCGRCGVPYSKFLSIPFNEKYLNALKEYDEWITENCPEYSDSLKYSNSKIFDIASSCFRKKHMNGYKFFSIPFKAKALAKRIIKRRH